MARDHVNEDHAIGRLGTGFDLSVLRLRNGRYCYPFARIVELKRRNRDVWNECATDLPQIRKAMKQFLPRLEAVDAKEGGSIKTVFG